MQLAWEEAYQRVVRNASVVAFADLSSGFAYHRFSPLNQFMAAGMPYVVYCLHNRVSDPAMQAEAEALSEDPGVLPVSVHAPPDGPGVD